MRTKRLHIDSKTEQLVTVREFIAQAASEFGFGDDDVSKISLAVDEACTNIIKHAYKFDPTRKIKITVKQSNGAFQVSIVDNGRYFDARKIEPPDMRKYLEHYRKGGLGVHLMRSLMDKVEYDLVPGKKNEVRLTKYISR